MFLGIFYSLKVSNSFHEVVKRECAVDRIGIENHEIAERFGTSFGFPNFAECKFLFGIGIIAVIAFSFDEQYEAVFQPDNKIGIVIDEAV